ncbi:DUF6975 family protein [Sphingomonas psychrotolerans]|uniref:Uncharacterized protein n=1 Tax=Sphingomonas psychrotolerans TaxID=1327635 RepID=A0A2K8MJF7_9SPHN|nr:hypothetical protein [Sphingomonas psychrotolerans]ATY31331.1 hypothetical protein CVN68_04495 [Sphingomonas psychrotolerans]
MPFDTAQIARLGGTWGAMGSLVASDGSANHPWLQRIARHPEPLRDLADAAHFICVLHGRHPGVVDYALDHARVSLERDWLEAAANAFSTERAYLVRIVAAAGPLPSTPGHSESEAAAQAQRHALDMLAQSDRAGCAAGAALALAIDWATIRAVLDAVAARLGLTVPVSTLPLAEETVSVVDALAREGAMERAMLFGAQQVFAQHRGLWDLLESRASARARA